MEICNNYKDSKTSDEATVKFEGLRFSWHSFSIIIGIDLEKINHWLAFWNSLVGEFCSISTWVCNPFVS